MSYLKRIMLELRNSNDDALDSRTSQNGEIKEEKKNISLDALEEKTAEETK